MENLRKTELIAENKDCLLQEVSITPSGEIQHLAFAADIHIHLLTLQSLHEEVIIKSVRSIWEGYDPHYDSKITKKLHTLDFTSISKLGLGKYFSVNLAETENFVFLLSSAQSKQNSDEITYHAVECF